MERTQIERGVTLADAAKRLCVSVRTLRGWVTEKRVPAVKVGRRWLIREAVINSLLTRGAIDDQDTP